MENYRRLVFGLALCSSACDYAPDDNAPTGEDGAATGSEGDSASDEPAGEDGGSADDAADGQRPADAGESGEDDDGDSEGGAGPPNDGGGADTTTGDPGGGSDSEDEGARADTTGGPPTLFFDIDILPIIAENCGCHRGANPSAGLDLHDDVAFDSLVGQASNAGPDYVVAGAPDDSYVLHKLQGTQASVGGFGSQMPLGEPLALSSVDTFSTWIEQGAQ